MKKMLMVLWAVVGIGLAGAVEPDWDVIVAGGGPAGIGAAYTAAKRGVKVLVLEKGGRLGGMAVSAMVSPFSFCTENPIARDIAKRIGFAHSVDFHAADIRAYDLLKEAGAEVMLTRMSWSR